MQLSAGFKRQLSVWGRTVGIIMIAVCGVVLSLWLPSCSLFTPAKVTSPYTDRPASEVEILAQRDAYEAQQRADAAAEETRRKLELERLTRQQEQTLLALKRKAEAELRATQLSQEQERVVLIEKHSAQVDEVATKYDDALSTRREAWVIDDAKRAGDAIVIGAKHDAALAELEEKRAAMGAVANLVQTVAANVPLLNNVAVRDENGETTTVSKLLAGMFGVGGTLGAIFYGRKAAKNAVTGEVKASVSHDEAWEESAKVTHAARDREDAAWEDGYKRAQTEAQQGMLMQALAAIAKLQQPALVAAPVQTASSATPAKEGQA